MQIKLGIRRDDLMDKEEVLARSRAENGNQDVYAQEVLKKASRCALSVQVILASVFFITQILAGGGINYGLWAMVISSSATISWIKYKYLRSKLELASAIINTIALLLLTVIQIYDLIASSTIL